MSRKTEYTVRDGKIIFPESGTGQVSVDLTDKLAGGKVLTGFTKQLDIVIPTGMTKQYLKELNDLINMGRRSSFNVNVVIWVT